MRKAQWSFTSAIAIAFCWSCMVGTGSDVSLVDSAGEFDCMTYEYEDFVRDYASAMCWVVWTCQGGDPANIDICIDDNTSAVINTAECALPTSLESPCEWWTCSQDYARASDALKADPTGCEDEVEDPLRTRGLPPSCYAFDDEWDGCTVVFD